MQGIRPKGKRVLLKRLDGDGREEQLASGVWKPARDESLRHGNAARVPMTFRAQVLAISELAAKATSELLHVGDVVHCHTYEQTNTRTLTGDETPYGLLVDVDNILGVEEESASIGRPLERSLDLAAYAQSNANAMSNSIEREQAIANLGFHRRQGGF